MDLLLIEDDKYIYSPSECFPSVIIRLMSQPPVAISRLQLPHVAPALVIL